MLTIMRTHSTKLGSLINKYFKTFVCDIIFSNTIDVILLNSSSSAILNQSQLLYTSVLEKKKKKPSLLSNSLEKINGDITKTCLFKWTENFTTQKWKFSDKNFFFFFFFFHISAQNIDCGYSLEPPRWDGSNEYPQSMFWAEHTPVNPSFTI